MPITSSPRFHLNHIENVQILFIHVHQGALLWPDAHHEYMRLPGQLAFGCRALILRVEGSVTVYPAPTVP